MFSIPFTNNLGAFKKKASITPDIDCDNKLNTGKTNRTFFSKAHEINDLKEFNYEKSEILDIFKFVDKQNRKNHLKFSNYDIIQMYFCNCLASSKLRNTIDLYQKSITSLDEYLDISFIIQKLEEFEKLKLLCLNYEQLAVFNFTAKDYCSMNDIKQGESTISKYKEFNKDNEKLVAIVANFRKRVNEESEMSEIDRKLYDLLREDLKV
jgi:hypothetical protein